MAVDRYVYLAKENEVLHSQIADRIEKEYKEILGTNYNILSTGFASFEGYGTDYCDRYEFDLEKL